MAFRLLAALAFLAFSSLSAQAQTAETLRSEAFALFAGTADDKARAIDLFEQAAEAGDAISMAFLGDLYASGNGVPMDRAKAIQWYLKAAHAGHAASSTKLAEMATGDAPVDTPASSQPTQAPVAAANDETFSEAESLYLGIDDLNDSRLPELRKTILAEATAGSVSAMATIAMIYRDGAGGTQDRAEAFRWYQRAADAGNASGYAGLAQAYEEGWGTRRDFDQALFWYEKAHAAGSPFAARNIARVQDAKRSEPALVPGVNWPLEDRWSAFLIAGETSAVGIAKNNGMFAFACANGNVLIAIYEPESKLAYEATPDAPKVLLMVPDNVAGAVAETTSQSSYFISDPDVVAGWASAAARANTLEIGISDPFNGQQFRLDDATTFTARGSSAAISDLRSSCR